MPVHDWSRVGAGIFHDFHCAWIVEIRNALNGGLLPPDHDAMAEQIIGYERSPDRAEWRLPGSVRMTDRKEGAMSEISLTVPDEALSALRMTPEQFGAELRLAAAVKLYEL